MKKKIPITTIVLYLILFALISAFIFIYYFQKTLGPGLIRCAENEVRYITTLVMNNSIRKYNKENISNNYLEITKNNKGEITLIRYNTKAINDTTTKITELLEKDLQNLTKANFKDIDLKLNTITEDYYEKINDGIIFTISSGTATGNNLLANIGPKIPLKLKLVGEVETNLKSKVKEYGLNNAMIELYIECKATTIIQMPFLSKEITITNKIPLTMEIIQGNLPEYYMGTQKIN